MSGGKLASRRSRVLTANVPPSPTTPITGQGGKPMNKTLLFATAVTVGLAMTAPAKADRILLQMLGEAAFVGDLNAANAEAGTNVTEADVFGATGLTIDPTGFDCFRMPLLDPATKLHLGSGIDCLHLIGGGVAAVSFFIFHDGSLANAGLTSLGAFTIDVGDNPVVPGDPASPSPLLMTGSIPNLTSDSIVAATGRFDGYVGTGRVSGAIFPGPLANDPDFPNFWFNCLWEINLQPNPGFANAAAQGNNRN